MPTLSHIRTNAAKVAWLGLFLAALTLVVAAVSEHNSARDGGCCGQEVGCSIDFGVIGKLPVFVSAAPPSYGVTTTFRPPAASAPESTGSIAPRLHTGRRALLHIAPKTSPPA